MPNYHLVHIPKLFGGNFKVSMSMIFCYVRRKMLISFIVQNIRRKKNKTFNTQPSKKNASKSDSNTKNLLCIKPNSFALKYTKKSLILEAHERWVERTWNSRPRRKETELFGNIIYMRILSGNRPDVTSIGIFAWKKIYKRTWKMLFERFAQRQS